MVLVSTQTDANGQPLPVWSGGHPSYKHKSISAGDVSRIQQMYPLQPASGSSNPRAREVGNTTNPWPEWGAVRVVVDAQFTTTIMPAPTYDAKEVAAAEANNFGCPAGDVCTLGSQQGNDVNMPPFNSSVVPLGPAPATASVPSAVVTTTGSG